MHTSLTPMELVAPSRLKARFRRNGMNACLAMLLAVPLFPAIAPIAQAQETEPGFCGERNYEVISLSRSPIAADSLLRLQREQGLLKLVVDSDRVTSDYLEYIARDEMPILIDIAKTTLSARDIRDLTRRSNQVQVLVNRDRIKAKDLRTLARSGASFIIDVGTTSISPKDIRSLQRSLRQTAKDLEILVTSERISPQNLRSIARGGARVIFDVGATQISLRDIKSVHRQNGRTALFVTANRFDERDIKSFLRYGGSVVGSPFCL